MPSVVPFLNLCYEVSRRYKFDKRILLDTEGNVIMDFSPKELKQPLARRDTGTSILLSIHKNSMTLVPDLRTTSKIGHTRTIKTSKARD